MTVVFDGVRINPETVWMIVEHRKTPLFMATDIAYMFGFRNVDSNHALYRPILRALNKLHAEGRIGKYFVPEANISVFYRLEK